eukprot:337876-Prymnesium_polylepis.1
MPSRQEEDVGKLAARLVGDPALAALCCGCSWQSVSEPKALDRLGNTAAAPHGGARLDGDGALKWTVRCHDVPPII